MKKIPAFKKIAFYGAIVIALIMIAKYTFYPPSDTASVANNNSSQSTTTTTPDTTTDIKILKSEVTDTAKFYPYKIDGVTMEVLAIKASDGTIRTALNTCQICYDSGRGYYVQDGEYLVCQNCGNRFNKDQVEIIKGGCNPIPVLEDEKQDAGDYIIIPKDYMATQKDYFSNWQKG